MKWDMMSTSSVNCPGESDISQGLLKHNSWDVPFTRRLQGKTPDTPSYVQITDRLATNCICAREGGCSLGPVNSSEACRQQTTKEQGQIGVKAM